MQGNPLSQLDDVMVPEQVSAWPPGPAWWIIAAVLLIAAVLALALYVRQRRHNRAKREALRLAQSQDAARLHQLLKRLGKHYYGTRVAALSAERWSQVLTLLSDIDFNARELQQLYQPRAVSDELKNKLHQAIKQFKTKERIDV
ncbi:DUF4381 domain-containing protein [Pseudoalteromonas sp. CnMc7-15]|uniref:DUF4381 domain-containing protein n=1 Tax=unclassified Pseudoalteromonas TaxID=194690 RepID=UPI001EF6BBF0|nr:DUF4381 domain-containing protein [Pseudoalteromonas sp. CnMc7-15]MCG7567601.1 DUF4381 domain-containing protein [Pseudoalteromonas sp. CnMc7-15]